MKITVIGDFAFGEPVYSGQTAKCRDICNMLSSKYVDSKIKTIDTRGWKKHIFSRMIFLIFYERLCVAVVQEWQKNYTSFFN